MPKPTAGPWQVFDGHVYAPWSQPAPFTDLQGVEHPNYRSGAIALVYAAHEQWDDDAGDAIKCECVDMGLKTERYV